MPQWGRNHFQESNVIARKKFLAYEKKQKNKKKDWIVMYSISWNTAHRVCVAQKLKRLTQHFNNEVKHICSLPCLKLYEMIYTTPRCVCVH